LIRLRDAKCWAALTPMKPAPPVIRIEGIEMDEAVESTMAGRAWRLPIAKGVMERRRWEPSSGQGGP